MHEACLHVSSGHTLRSEIQTDTEIIAVAVILVNTHHEVGRATMYIGIGGLGNTASIKMGKKLDVIAMHSI